MKALIGWAVFTMLVLVAIISFLFFGADIIGGLPKNNVQALSDKCYQICTNPNANYYDQYGNEFNYQGQLIQVATVCITGNPYCTLPQPMPAVTIPMTGFSGK